MSLWTPYAQEAVLDLSNSAVIVDPASPVSTSSATLRSPSLPEPHPSYIDSQFYATALDLSKPTVKVELVSPVPASSAPTYPSPPSGSSAGYSNPLYTESQYYATYPYQPVVMYAVPSTTMMSPDSIGTHSRPTAPSPSISHHQSQEIHDSSSLLDDEEYLEFERDALQAMAVKNGGSLLGNNPRMRRAVQSSQPADDAYRQQRERNNLAAKQSRNRRTMREFRLASQVMFLQKKVIALRAQLVAGCGRCRSSE